MRSSVAVGGGRSPLPFGMSTQRAMFWCFLFLGPVQLAAIYAWNAYPASSIALAILASFAGLAFLLYAAVSDKNQPNK